MNNNTKHIDKRAVICTTITTAIFIALLFIFGFKLPQPKEESGMLINFGNTETGIGNIEPAKSMPAPKVSPPPPPKSTTQPQIEASKSPEAIETQDFEEAAAIETAKKKAKEEEEELKKIEREKEIEKKREIEIQKEIERQKKLEIERKRQEEQERIERELLEKEAKAEAIRKQTANVFGKTSSSSTSQGTNGGQGNQGNPNGGTNTNGKGLGISGDWYLAGRSPIGSLPKPQSNIQKQGIVVIEILVDQSGKVINATPRLEGTTTHDEQLKKLAIEAAFKARFTANPQAQIKQKGTITYKFVLN